jgi:hypothetical protein
MKLIVAFCNFVNMTNNKNNPSLSAFCVAEICLRVLQIAVGSLQSQNSDTEWIICVNVVPGGILCTKSILRT